MTPDPLLALVSAALRAQLAADLGWGRVAGSALADVAELLPAARAAVERLPDRASDELDDDLELDDLLRAAVRPDDDEETR